MIRAVVLILGLVLGLFAAATVGGRLAHLRAVAPASVPIWAAGFDGASGVLEGQGQMLGADLRWHLGGFGLLGPQWQLSLSGADWQAQGVGRLTAKGFQIEGLSGLIPGALLETGSTGMLALEGGVLDLMMPGAWLLEGSAQGQARDLTLDGAVLNAAVTLRMDYGDWGVRP